MRTTIAIALVVLVAVAAASDYKSMFESFKSQHARKYESAEEEGKRFDIFVENMKKAEKMNQGNPLARFGANEFADMSAAEFKTRHNADKLYAKLAQKAGSPKATFSAEQVKAVSQKDWRKEGAVTGVKNQGQCGSCWSFSTTGGIEGQWFLAGNKLTSLSEQLFVSCDTIDHGCQGGLMDNAFNWVISDNKGDLVTEASYPYVSGGGQVPPCQKQGKTFGAKIIGHQDIAHNEDQMAAFVGTGGPLSIAVDASSWQTYMGGIMTNCQSTQLDHGVLIVGYDKTNSPPYWIVKNSWGPGWGESGYIRLEYGTNQCLINNYPTTSKVANGPNPGPTPPTPPSPPSPTSPPTPPAPGKGAWTDLFQPPYTQVPKITLGISCVADKACYIPGGTNAGFDVLKFNGEPNGVFTPMRMPDKAVMILGIAMGGDSQNPKGAVAGLGIGDGVQYAANSTTFLPSIVDALLVQSQDARATDSGNDILVVDMAGANMLYSGDGGKYFSKKPVSADKFPILKNSSLRYTAIPSPNTWYVTAGSWPNNNNKNKDEFQRSERVSMVRGADGKFRRVAKNMLNVPRVEDYNGYTAAIFKTTDGGKTFVQQYSSETNFYFNGIDCEDELRCVAVGEGFNADPAGHVFTTTDGGKTWRETLKLKSSQAGMYSLMNVRFSSKGTVWIAGSKAVDQFMTHALFYVSKNGGETWELGTQGLSNIGDVSDVSFLRDGTGFATAITSFDDSTILRYWPNGPAPGPNPGPSPVSGSFVQSHCADAACSQSCQNITFHTGICIPVAGGGAAIVECDLAANQIKETVYSNQQCSGSGQVNTMPLDKCLRDEQGSYFENYCPKAVFHVAQKATAMRTMHRRQ